MPLFELFIIAIGLISLFITVFVFLNLRKIGHKLSNAVSYMVLAEICTNSATLFFATTAALGVYDAIPPLTAGLLRLLIFIPITGTSVYLFYTCFRIELEAENG